MRLLLLGCNGQVGWELRRSLAPLGELICAAREPDAQAAVLGLDLSDPVALERDVRALRPDVIVNAAAYTAVDKAESEPELAHLVNAQAPAVLARIARDTGAWIIDYSTDYVFDGSGEQPWRETDPTGPLNVYGASKLAGEQAIVGACERHLIFRTSWVYGVRGGNFARTMLRLAAQRDHLTVVSDQIGAPTSASLLADLTAQAIPAALVDHRLAGIYHLVAAGQTSWHAYAQLVIRTALQAGVALRLDESDIEPIASSAYPTPARRPLNSRLDTRKLRTAFGFELPQWQTGVQRMLGQIL